MQLELPQVLSLLVVICRLGEKAQLSEVCVRVTLVAVRTNMAQLMSSRTAAPLLTKLNTLIHLEYTKTLQVSKGVYAAVTLSVRQWLL